MERLWGWQAATKWESAVRLYFEINDISCTIRVVTHYQSIDACRTVFNECLEGNGRKQERIMSLIKALEEAHLSELSADSKIVFSNYLITANVSVIIIYLNFRFSFMHHQKHEFWKCPAITNGIAHAHHFRRVDRTTPTREKKFAVLSLVSRLKIVTPSVKLSCSQYVI